MIRYIVRRLLLAVLSIWFISILSFVIIQMPEGDWLDTYLENVRRDGFPLSPETERDMRAYYGLDQPMVFRYLKWSWNLLQGDAGWSYIPRGTSVRGEGMALIARPVTDIVMERLLLTIALTAFTIAVTWVLAIPIGIYSAIRHNSIGDYTFTFFGFMGLAVPDFLLGLLLMYIAFAYFDQSVGGLFSADFRNAPWGLARLWDLLKHLWIPALVLGTSGTASLIRVLRNNLLDELRKPYVVTARSKGLSGWRTVLKYPLRVAINPLLSTIGYLLPALVSGSVIVSLVLGLSTIGPVLLAAITIQDTYLAGFIVLMLGVLTVIGTLISDLVLAWADPRIRYVD